MTFIVKKLIAAMWFQPYSLEHINLFILLDFTKWIYISCAHFAVVNFLSASLILKIAIQNINYIISAMEPLS